jgi:ATP-dependent DNA helicase RecG
METSDLIEVISRGEDSRHQFKANITNVSSLAEEIVAFSNSGGGRIFIGVNDDGSVRGLSKEDISRLNNLISNAASQNVRPAVNPLTENVAHPGGIVLVVTIPDGLTKPYMDSRGVILVKSGANKQPASSREELQRLFQQNGLLHADETPVHGLGVGDIDLTYFESFFQEQFGETLTEQRLSLPQLLANLNLLSGSSLNLAGALLFARTPQFRLPTCIVKAVTFPGTSITDDRYLDSRDIAGKLADVYREAMAFIKINTHAIQGDRSVNSLGMPEVPLIVWQELIANALVHRDYFISAPVRLLIFADRVEIISPGHLPNNLTIANIKAGNSNIRNPILASFAAKLLPYRGLGSGILRALRAYPRIEFIEDRPGNLFKAIVARPSPVGAT